MTNYLIIDKIIKNTLKEDVTSEDITTNSIVPEDAVATVDLIAKEKGVMAGLFTFNRVFEILGNVEVDFFKTDGEQVIPGDKIALIRGNARSILTGERTALNLLQRLSGIATLTSLYAEKLQGTKAKVVDTRKTTPGLRVLEKYAVRVGGGANHRFNLSDGILIKDNHIGAAGGITNAVNLARQNTSFVNKIEVEVEDFNMLDEALAVGADIIMLDNMNPDMMKEAVKRIDGRAITEASGNVSLDTIEEIGKTGVDYISVGKLTHSVSALDISMKNMKLNN
ncbi:nicotinate-nucleotide pyrophosphorylase [carboxylating] [Alkalibaculum bacchi]|uniref:Probable nicotinate-nucleotide pyrophosphorylase [carboxylating] n=1 Tax=Alkalibaculum bacchi TaxID=645887 RepID=A0A366ID31_9FIRM|nr:carboxylating nicotinate-nucleotide diphosphorylase [Alkalibaculum bacchi]RBP67339.1 nicotinate-nucleotide pyrophosphorylase [carboxylating] [Alkalibaculum bacchi]